MDVHRTALVNDQTVLEDLSQENKQFDHEGERRAGDASAPQQTMEVDWNDESKEASFTNVEIGDAELDIELHAMEDQKIMSAFEREKRFGVECKGPAGDGVLFRAGTWKTGGEYVQKLVVRNVGTTVKKLKYQLPSSRFFSLAYPEVIILSPGMSKEIDVIFRPVEVAPYDDTIFMKVIKGPPPHGFHISVKATIEKLVVSSPFGIDMGFCPTYQTTSDTFEISNDGAVDAPFRWEQPEGFLLEPSEGIIPIGRSCTIKVSVVPTEATVFVAKAVCHIGEGTGPEVSVPEPIIETRLSCIGKYAYINLSDQIVDFGEVLSGSMERLDIVKEIVLRNNSAVPADWSLIRHESDMDEVFDIEPKEGSINAQQEQLITIKYHPLSAGGYTLDRYTFITPGDCRASLQLQGCSVDTKVDLFKDPGPSGGKKEAKKTEAGAFGSTAVQDVKDMFPEASPYNALNFRDVEIGKSETRVLMLKNHSKKDVPFSVMSHVDSTFKIHPQQGVIGAQAPPFAVMVTFTPTRPNNYYRRIWVTIADRMPSFYDCMGSGYIRAKGEVKEQRPAPLRFAHVQAYRNRAVQGKGGLNPDELDEMYTKKRGDISWFAQPGQSGTVPYAISSSKKPLARSGDCDRNEVAIAHEFFIQDTDHSSRDITLDKDMLDFGYNPAHKTSDSKTLTVHNNTNGKVSMFWDVSRIVSETGEIQDSSFFITPETADINAGHTQTFKITFRPFQTDRNYVSEMEAFVYFKNQRTFRLVNDETLTPPWCLSLKAYGHTFGGGQLLATTRFSGGNIIAGKLTMPCCMEGECMYQTVTLKNTSNLPAVFKFEFGFGHNTYGGFDGDASKLGEDVFSVKPDFGEIGAESHICVIVRFQPTRNRKYVQVLQAIVNGEPSAKLLVEGSCTTPNIVCPDATPQEGGVNNTAMVLNNGVALSIPGVLAPPHNVAHGPVGTFYMKPTCAGLSSSRTFRLKNNSRLPLQYILRLPADATNILSVTPSKGILRGNQIANITIAFAPKTSEKYMFRLKCKVYPIGGRVPRVIDARQPMPVEEPEEVQTFNVLVVAPGEIGAIQFDPPIQQIGVRLVNTKETRDFYLENVSDSELEYELLYKEEFVLDTGHAVSASNAKKDMITSAVRPLRISQPNSGERESLLCEKPTGTILARSKFKVPMTFQPTHAGAFEFFIYCRIKVYGDGQYVSNEEVALLRVSQQDRETCMASVFDTNSLQALPLTASITSTATFPKMNIEDVRLETEALINDVSHLWRNFALSELNEHLSKPLTDTEVKLNLSASPDLEALHRYRFEMTPNIVGSPKQVVTFQIKNNGLLTTNFHVHLPNEKDLELEAWCDEDEPSEELYKIICMIEELKLFDIQPAGGTLEPGQSTKITISYSHAYLKYGGVHNLPLHVKIDQGKQFFIDLCGRTLPSTGGGATAKIGGGLRTGGSTTSAQTRQPKILALTNVNALPPVDIMLSACIGQSGAFGLRDIPIGLSVFEAPMQRMELINVSASRAIYQVEMESIDTLISENFNCPVLRISNPTGIIEPRSSTYIDWYFYPAEAKTYKCPITITYDYAMTTDAFPLKDGLESPSQGPGSLILPQPPSSPAKSGRQSSKQSASGKNADGIHSSVVEEDAEYHKKHVQFELRATGYDPRELDVQGNYVDGRDKDKPIIYGLQPPAEQLISYPSQLCSVSHDLIDLKVVPQNSKTNRIIVIRNLMEKTRVEFAIQVDDCASVRDGIVSIYPTSGVLEKGDHVVVDLSFNFSIKAMEIVDRIKIITREIVVGVTKRRGAATTKLLEKVVKKKEDKEHESVVNRVTRTRNIQLAMQQIPEGKNVAMPNTINRQGEVVPGVKYGTDPMAPDGGDGGAKGIGFNMNESSIGFEPSQASLSFADGGTMMASSIDEGPSIDGAQTANTNRSSTAGGDSPGKQPSSSKSVLSGSSMGKRSKKTDDNQQRLLGKSNTFIVRLRGSILPYETFCQLFRERAQSQSLSQFTTNPKDTAFLHDIFVPPNSDYIVPINAATFMPSGEPEAAPPRPKLLGVLDTLSTSQQFELRDVSHSIMSELFKSLLDSDKVSEYIDQVMEQADSCDVVKAMKEKNTSATLYLDGEIDGNTPPKGNPAYGMYIHEFQSETATTIDGNVDASATTVNNSVAEDMKLMEIHSEKSQEVAVNETLRDGTFLDLAADILRNTLYNLMQEASFEEFPLMAEPLTFKIKGKHSPTRSP
jgi:hypothetical protein